MRENQFDPEFTAQEAELASETQEREILDALNGNPDEPYPEGGDLLAVEEAIEALEEAIENQDGDDEDECDDEVDACDDYLP